MRYRRLGRTGLQVSELSLGAARGASTDPEGFKTTVHAVIDAGINLIDTAESYENGVSESVLGEALVGRHDVLVETKYRPYDSHAPDANYTGSPERLVTSVEGSLRRLRRDRIDILLGHGIRSLATLDRFMSDGCYEAMVKLREQGQGPLHRHQRAVGRGWDASGAAAGGAHRGLRRGDADAQLPAANCRRRGAAAVPPARCGNGGDDAAQPGVEVFGAGQRAGRVGVRATPRRRREICPPSRRTPIRGCSTSCSRCQSQRPGCATCWRTMSARVAWGCSTPQRLQENLRAVDPPYLDPATLARLRELFGRIQQQVR